MKAETSNMRAWKVARYWAKAWVSPESLRAWKRCWTAPGNWWPERERYPWRWLSEVLYAAYFSYYLMIVGVGIALYARDRGQFDHFVGVVSVVFYCCYATYLVLPVVGPRIFYQDWGALGLPPEAKLDETRIGRAVPVRIMRAGATLELPFTVEVRA